MTHAHDPRFEGFGTNAVPRVLVDVSPDAPLRSVEINHANLQRLAALAIANGADPTDISGLTIHIRAVAAGVESSMRVTADPSDADCVEVTVGNLPDWWQHRLDQLPLPLRAAAIRRVQHKGDTYSHAEPAARAVMLKRLSKEIAATSLHVELMDILGIWGVGTAAREAVRDERQRRESARGAVKVAGGVTLTFGWGIAAALFARRIPIFPDMDPDVREFLAGLAAMAPAHGTRWVGDHIIDATKPADLRPAGVDANERAALARGLDRFWHAAVQAGLADDRVLLCQWR